MNKPELEFIRTGSARDGELEAERHERERLQDLEWAKRSPDALYRYILELEARIKKLEKPLPESE